MSQIFVGVKKDVFVNYLNSVDGKLHDTGLYYENVGDEIFRIYDMFDEKDIEKVRKKRETVHKVTKIPLEEIGIYKSTIDLIE